MNWIGYMEAVSVSIDEIDKELTVSQLSEINSLVHSVQMLCAPVLTRW